MQFGNLFQKGLRICEEKAKKKKTNWKVPQFGRVDIFWK